MDKNARNNNGYRQDGGLESHIFIAPFAPRDKMIQNLTRDEGDSLETKYEPDPVVFGMAL